MAVPAYTEIPRTVDDDKPARLRFGSDLSAYTLTMRVPALSLEIVGVPESTTVFAFDCDEDITAAAGEFEYTVTASGGPESPYVIAVGAWVVAPLPPSDGITWGEVLALPAAELTATSPLMQRRILRHVNGSGVNPLAFGDDIDLARALLAAHMATALKNAARGNVGPVQSQTVGKVSRSYAVVASTANLATTGYGVAYQGMIDRSLECRLPIVL